MTNEKVVRNLNDYRSERLRWVRSHGSERLQRIERLGLLDQSDRVYRDERLEAERPGWRWMNDAEDELRDVLNPSMETLDALEAARERDPNASLTYVVCGDWKGPAVLARFLDRTILKDLGRAHLDALVEKVYASLANEHAASVAGVVLDEAHKGWLMERTKNLLVWLAGDLR